jgi:transposase-like protein
MKRYTESYCLAILITNLHQRKRYPDPITVAECAKFLHEMYGSFEEVSRLVGVHPSVIRKWVSLANAPENLRQCVKEGKVYPVAAFRILAAFKDNSKIKEITKELSGWGEPEIVRFVKFVKQNPQLSVSECKSRFMIEVIGKLMADSNNATSDIK